MQKVYGEPAAAAVIEVGGPVHPDTSQPAGGPGPGGETGLSPGDGSATSGPPAFPSRPADQILAGPRRPHTKTLPCPGASPGAIRPRSSALSTGFA